MHDEFLYVTSVSMLNVGFFLKFKFLLLVVQKQRMYNDRKLIDNSNAMKEFVPRIL